jgi:type IV pilus assembly protein PilN
VCSSDLQLINLQGVAQSQERVSELLRNLSNNAAWFTRPELIEIVAARVTLGREVRPVFNFTMRVRLVRTNDPQRAQPSAAVASGAAPAASGAAPVASAAVAAAATPAKK